MRLPGGELPLRTPGKSAAIATASISLKTEFLSRISRWASSVVPPLGSFFGYRLARTCEKAGVSIPVKLQCQRCASVLEPGVNCSLKESERPKGRAVYVCDYCGHRNRAAVKKKKKKAPSTSLKSTPISASSSKKKRKGWASLKDLAARKEPALKKMSLMDTTGTGTGEVVDNGKAKGVAYMGGGEKADFKLSALRKVVDMDARISEVEAESAAPPRFVPQDVIILDDEEPEDGDAQTDAKQLETVSVTMKVVESEAVTVRLNSEAVTEEKVIVASGAGNEVERIEKTEKVVIMVDDDDDDDDDGCTLVRTEVQTTVTTTDIDAEQEKLVQMTETDPEPEKLVQMTEMDVEQEKLVQMTETDVEQEKLVQMTETDAEQERSVSCFVQTTLETDAEQERTDSCFVQTTLETDAEQEKTDSCFVQTTLETDAEQEKAALVFAQTDVEQEKSVEMTETDVEQEKLVQMTETDAEQEMSDSCFVQTTVETDAEQEKTASSFVQTDVEQEKLGEMTETDVEPTETDAEQKKSDSCFVQTTLETDAEQEKTASVFVQTTSDGEPEKSPACLKEPEITTMEVEVANTVADVSEDAGNPAEDDEVETVKDHEMDNEVNDSEIGEEMENERLEELEDDAGSEDVPDEDLVVASHGNLAGNKDEEAVDVIVEDLDDADDVHDVERYAEVPVEAVVVSFHQSPDVSMELERFTERERSLSPERPSRVVRLDSLLTGHGRSSKRNTRSARYASSVQTARFNSCLGLLRRERKSLDEHWQKKLEQVRNEALMEKERADNAVKALEAARSSEDTLKRRLSSISSLKKKIRKVTDGFDGLCGTIDELACQWTAMSDKLSRLTEQPDHLRERWQPPPTHCIGKALEAVAQSVPAAPPAADPAAPAALETVLPLVPEVQPDLPASETVPATLPEPAPDAQLALPTQVERVERAPAGAARKPAAGTRLGVSKLTKRIKKKPIKKRPSFCYSSPCNKVKKVGRRWMVTPL